MKSKFKDGTKLNLYVDRKIVRILDTLSKRQGTSRSQFVEQLVRRASSPAGDGTPPDIAGNAILEANRLVAAQSKRGKRTR